MRLVVDASVLVGELLRESGRARLASDRLELFLPEHTWSELQHELPRRVDRFAARRGLDDEFAAELVARCLAAVVANVVIVPEVAYSPLEDEARVRSQRDPNDWPIVALALVLEAGVWTEDKDFLGTGVPTWTTGTLRAWLLREP
jgi:predicted nucleic acid-binding protein